MLVNLTKIVFLIIMLYPQFALSQDWIYKKTENVFDGTIHSARTLGSGGKFPYTNPALVINYFSQKKSLNVYITNAGYAGCRNSIILAKFDGEDSIYEFEATPDLENESWFFNYGYSISIEEFIEKIKLSNNLNIRLQSDCNQYDYVFGLVGASLKINLFYPEYLKHKREEDARIIKIEEEQIRLEKEARKIKLEQERQAVLQREREIQIQDSIKKSLDPEKIIDINQLAILISETNSGNNNKSLFVGQNNTVLSDQGVTYQPGNQGSESGTPGTNQNGAGGGEGITLNLSNRSAYTLPKPTYLGQEEGIVVVHVTVNQNGMVLKAEPGVRGSTSLDSGLLISAKLAALSTRFNQDKNAPAIQTGTITYRFLK